MRSLTGFLLLLLLISCAKDKKSAQTTAESQEIKPSLPAGNSERGKSLYPTCAACHGPAGEGNAKLKSPAIANVDGWYMYRQLMNFRKGLRGYHEKDTLGIQMAAMAKTLPDSLAVADVVAYVKSFPVVSITPVIKGDPQKGEQYYQTVCGGCHGPKGSGNEKMNAPRLAGLQDEYIFRQVKHFKFLFRGNKAGDRFGAQMVTMMTLIPDDDAIRNIISYIRTSDASSK